MCLIAFAYQADSRLPLVLAANRDEFYTRPTEEAALWQDGAKAGRILAGRDRLAGGTWLGITRGGRFAAVTNIRDPSQPESKPRSRGELTRAFLSGDESPEQYCQHLSNRFDEFAGYNLLVGDRESLYYVNNFAGVVEALSPGVYGLSNGRLNSDWPKVSLARERLETLLGQPETLNTDALIAIMADRRQAAVGDLPNTGIPVELERKLSSAFIVNPERQYGTLCSTAIIMDSEGGIRFSEQNFDQSGEPTSRHFFQLEPEPERRTA